MSETIQTDFQSFAPVNWVQQAGYWQLPPHQPATSDKDAFMLGGNGRVSARMGMQKDYSTIDRFMGPEYDSYAYHQNNYFRRSEVGISREHPHECITEQQRLWRVPQTAIMCSWESVRLQHERDVWFRGVEIVTVNFVLPDATALLRLIAVKNNSRVPVDDIRLVLDAVPDVPWPRSGHCSEIRPHKGGRLIEKVTEFARLEDQTVGNYFSKEKVERYRYCIRGLLEGENRGFEQLASGVMNLQCDQEKIFLASLAVSPDGSVEGAEKVEAGIVSEIKNKGFFAPLERTYAWWQKWMQDGIAVTCPHPAVADFLDAATVHQKQAEHHTGGFMVGDDYTQCFIRDCNGSHHWLLDTGHPEEVRRSMEFFFRMDTECGNFQNSYELDLGKSFVEPKPPYWFEKDVGKKEIVDWIVSGHKETNPAEIKRHEFLTPGDVPNFRVLWYWHYHRRTGDLDLIEKRWSYLRALIRLQEFERFGYLAGYSRDETYGIGPVGPLRRGNSADNSFIALAAVRSLVTLAQRLNKKGDAEELQALADKIHHAIETQLWIESDGLYAMRVTPEGELDPRACSPGLLRPLYAGAAGPEDDHAARSVEFVLKHMMMQPGFIRIIPGDYYATCGHFPAYMLADLCKLDHPGVNKAFRDLMIYVNPAGTCAEYYDLSSPMPKPHMHRTRNWETGLDADAVLYYLTGFEPDAWAGRFSLKPHLPPEWDGFTVRQMRFGSSCIDLEVKRIGKGVQYCISHSGSQPIIMNGKFVLPEAGEAAKMKVDGKSVTASAKTGRYGVSRVDWDASLGPNGRIDIQFGE